MNLLQGGGDIRAAIAYCIRIYPQESFFANALALEILVESSTTAQLRDLIAGHLRQAFDHHWTQQAPLGELLAVINALHAHDADIVTGVHIAAVVQRLITAEAAPGGPYYERSLHCDSYTNYQAQRFALWAAGPLPQVSAFLQAQKHPESDYPDWLRTMPFEQDGRQLSDGSWPAIPVRVRPARVTSSLVSTARGIASLDTKRHDMLSISKTRTERILARMNHEISMTFDGTHGDVARQTLHRITQANHAHEISLMSCYFAEMLGEPLSSNELTVLGQANIYCWLGYMLYDEIIDTQSHTAHMPIVTAAIRRSIMLYREYLPEGARRIEQVFDEMDKANIWELQHARYAVDGDTITVGRLPQYGNLTQLARRSGGHILGPLLITQRHQPQRRHAITQGLQHYLIARQLHDDAHDWQEDLAEGHISYVVARLLRGAGITPGPYDLNALRTDLRALFWRQAAMEICDHIDVHLAQARHHLAGLPIRDNTAFYALVGRLEQASRRTRREHQRGSQFVQHFR